MVIGNPETPNRMLRPIEIVGYDLKRRRVLVASESDSADAALAYSLAVEVEALLADPDAAALPADDLAQLRAWGASFARQRSRKPDAP